MIPIKYKQTLMRLRNDKLTRLRNDKLARL